MLLSVICALGINTELLTHVLCLLGVCHLPLDDPRTYLYICVYMHILDFIKNIQCV